MWYLRYGIFFFLSGKHYWLLIIFPIFPVVILSSVFCIQAGGLGLDLLVEIVWDVKLILRIKVLLTFKTTVRPHFSATGSGVRGQKCVRTTGILNFLFKPQRSERWNQSLRQAVLMVSNFTWGVGGWGKSKVTEDQMRPWALLQLCDCFFHLFE